MSNIQVGPKTRRAVKPAKFRKPAKPYRLVIRKKSRFIAVRIGRKQRSSKECDAELARAFAYRWIAESFPRIAQELGIEVTPELKASSSSQFSVLSSQFSVIGENLAA